MNLTVFTDGGALNNPGPAASAYVIYKDNKELLFQEGVFLGHQTNNYAEYQAVVLALQKIKELLSSTVIAREQSDRSNLDKIAASSPTEVGTPHNNNKPLVMIKGDVDKIVFFSDSKLLVSQLNGLYKVKNGVIREFILKIRILEQEINLPISYTHVYREQNILADSLVKKALGR